MKSWLNRIFESNCLFMRRDLAGEIGGMDERFDLPGGGQGVGHVHPGPEHPGLEHDPV